MKALLGTYVTKMQRSAGVALALLFFVLMIGTTSGAGGAAAAAEAAAEPLDTPVNTIVAAADQAKIAVIPVPAQAGGYQSYSADVTGLRAALWELYENGRGQNVILYLGGNVTLGTSGLTGPAPAAVTGTNVTFAALSGRIGRMAITGSYTDRLDESTAAPSDAKTLNGGTTDWYLGVDTQLRNLRYTFRYLYAQAHALTLGGGSYHTAALTVYGGSADGTVTGDTQLAVYATGAGGTTVVGGSRTGTVDGNVTTTIYNTSGDLTGFYGAGYGPSATAMANVTGNVTSEIRNLGGSLGSAVYGGGYHANVGGRIQTTISGRGSQAVSYSKIIGASYYGNTGSEAGQDAVITTVDFSQYSGTNRRSFVGGNGLHSLGIEGGALRSVTGTITGNIRNKITAGAYNTGGQIHGVNGGGDFGTRIRDAGISERATAESLATFRVYGNIETELTKGCFSNGGGDAPGFARAAGYGGYIEGDTTIFVGTEDWAYGSSLPADRSYRVNTLTGRFANDATVRKGYGRGYAAGWDITGGGGKESQKGGIYIKGNTRLVHYRSLARWTYGGSFGGTIEGNTTAENHGGIVHTLEGAGYDAYLVKGGTSHAIVRGGQVDWFLSGGGWSDDRIEGNTAVSVSGGIVNAHVGGTYGDTATHVVTGDARIHITGGDFSGMAHFGSSNPDTPKRIAGGPSMYGTIEGNITVNLDYTENAGAVFRLPAGSGTGANQKSYLTGGVPYGTTAGAYVGTNTTETTIEINIRTGAGSEDSLAGAAIYGDGAAIAGSLGATGSLCRAERIIINVNAPGASIGDLYATNSRHALSKDVEINLDNAASVQGINGGSGRPSYADNFTNSVVAAAGTTGGIKNTARIRVGGDSAGGRTIAIGASGLQNFTTLTVDRAVLYSTGNVLNGSGVTLTNHGGGAANNYDRFGDITLQNSGGFGLAEPAYAAGGKLTVGGGESRLETPAGRGKVIITEFAAPASRLLWIPGGGDGIYEHTGTWFGQNQYYRVLTFSPAANYERAAGVTPVNFRGRAAVGGTTYRGDNSTVDGYALALPEAAVTAVCKIGETGYDTLEAAIAAANQAAAPTVIQMLVDNYELTEPVMITQTATLTTAAKTDEVLPYRGQNDRARITLATDLQAAAAALFTIDGSGSLTMTNLALDGNAAAITAAQPLLHNRSGRLRLGTDVLVEDYRGSSPVIVNEDMAGTAAARMQLAGGVIQGNTVSGGRGTIHNAAGARLEITQGLITANSGAAAGGIYNEGMLIISGGVIRDNQTPEGGAGGVYQAGEMQVSDQVVIRENRAGTTVCNVYLPATTTVRPYGSRIEITGALAAGSAIGVMTDTSPEPEDAGTLDTIVAVPQEGVGNMAAYFHHDQQERNAKAYAIVRDRRTDAGGELVLQEDYRLPLTGQWGLGPFMVIGGLLVAVGLFTLNLSAKRYSIAVNNRSGGQILCRKHNKNG